MFEGLGREIEDQANRAEKALTSMRIDINWATGDYKEAKELIQKLDDLDKEGDKLRAQRSTMREGSHPYGRFDMDPSGITETMGIIEDMADTQGEATVMWLANNPYINEDLVDPKTMDKIWEETQNGIKNDLDELEINLLDQDETNERIDSKRNQEERNLYDLANKNEAFRERSHKECLENAQYKKISPMISGLSPKQQKEIFNTYIEAGGDLITYIDTVPDSKGPSKEDYKKYTEHILNILKQKGGLRNNNEKLLGYNGLISNRNFPEEFALEIAHTCLDRLKSRRQFDHGRPGYELAYVFMERPKSPEIKEFEVALERKKSDIIDHS